MQKQFKEVAHLYIGCEVQTKIRRATGSGQPMKMLKGVLKEVDLGMSGLGILLEDEKDSCNYEYLKASTLKPLLRPISSLTEQEGLHLHNLYSDTAHPRVNQAATTAYLLSLGVDLFGLIEAGLAIDKTTLNKTA